MFFFLCVCVIVVCIVLGFFSQSQMRYHLKYYARDQLTSSNTISFLHLFFFFVNGNPHFVISNQSLLFFTQLTVCHEFRFHLSAGVLNQKSGYKEFSALT